MSLKVFVPVIDNAPAPPWSIAQLNVDPPPTNVFTDALVRLIEPVPVPAVVVKPVGTALLKVVVEAAAITIEPPLKVKFLVPVAVKNVVVEIVLDSVNVCPLRSSVPLASVTVPATFREVVKLVCKVQ
jgi:hypothetical protein